MRRLFCVLLLLPSFLFAEVKRDFHSKLSFEENVGQITSQRTNSDSLVMRGGRAKKESVDPAIRFILRGRILTYYFSDRGYSVVQNDSVGHVNRTDFYFENGLQIIPEGKIQENSNCLFYFPVGTIAAKKYGKIIYQNAVDGNDLEFTTHDGSVEKKLVITQSKIPSQISFEVYGSNVSQWQNGEGNSFTSVAGSFDEAADKNRSGCISKQHDRRLGSLLQTSDYFLKASNGNNQTQISSISWLTYLGGNSAEDLFGISLTNTNGVVVTGRTGSLNFPTTPGAMQDTLTLGYDAIITRFDSIGNCIWSTYYGGTNFDGANQIVAIDSTFVIAGMTNSTDLPMLFPTQASNHGGYDAFLLVLNSAGHLIRSTYYGGTGSDQGLCITKGPANEIVLGGSTTSIDLPFASSGYQGTMGGQIDASLTVFDNLLNVQWSTYYGGSSPEDIHAICVSPQGEITFVGGTRSFNFPVTANAWQVSLLNQPDNYLVKFGMNGARHYATFFGGTNNEDANGIVSDELGNLYMTGFTYSADFPIQGTVFQSTLMGQQDVYVSKFDVNGQLIWSTFVGGGGQDVAWGICRLGKYIFVCGQTESPTFPVSANAIQSIYAANSDGFVIKMDTTGQMISGTFLGGNGLDALLGITVDADTNVIACGDTYSTNLPVANAFQNTNGSNCDGYVVKFGMSEELISTNTISVDEDNSIAVFPNPSNGIINITTLMGTSAKIEIMDALGRVMVTEEGSVSSIDVSYLSSGIYFLKIADVDSTIHVLQFIRN